MPFWDKILKINVSDYILLADIFFIYLRPCEIDEVKGVHFLSDSKRGISS